MYSEDDRHLLKKLARDAIYSGLDHHAPLDLNNMHLPETLKQQAACFVTLYLHGALRGCIGSLEAYQPLAEDIVHNAYAAAFSDPRFAPVTESEAHDLEIHISILSAPQSMHVSSEHNLLEQLRSGIDGLIIEQGMRRATFLPSVWESLPNKEDFLLHLKLKAGFATDYWSDDMQCYRYQTESF